MFTYLRDYHNNELVFDPTEPEIDESNFVSEEWKDLIYRKKKEKLQTIASKH